MSHYSLAHYIAHICARVSVLNRYVKTLDQHNGKLFKGYYFIARLPKLICGNTCTPQNNKQPILIIYSSQTCAGVFISTLFLIEASVILFMVFMATIVVTWPALGSRVKCDSLACNAFFLLLYSWNRKDLYKSIHVLFWWLTMRALC